MTTTHEDDKSRENFYESKTYPAIELAILDKDLHFSKPKDIDAEFKVPIFTPLIEETEDEVRPVVEASYIGGNTITLTIPDYMVRRWTLDETGRGKIPKDTEFMIAFLGGDLDPMKCRIIAPYTMHTEKMYYVDVADHSVTTDYASDAGKVKVANKVAAVGVNEKKIDHHKMG